MWDRHIDNQSETLQTALIGRLVCLPWEELSHDSTWIWLWTLHVALGALFYIQGFYRLCPAINEEFLFLYRLLVVVATWYDTEDTMSTALLVFTWLIHMFPQTHKISLWSFTSIYQSFPRIFSLSRVNQPGLACNKKHHQVLRRCIAKLGQQSCRFCWLNRDP